MGVRYDQWVLAYNHQLKGSVEMSCLGYAQVVMAEAAPVPAVEGELTPQETEALERHEARQALARIVLRQQTGNRDAAVGQFTLVAAMDPKMISSGAVKAGIVDPTKFVDEDLDNHVRAQWNTVAKQTLSTSGPQPGTPYG